MTTIVCPNCQQVIKLYTTIEAAKYLGVSVASLKYHIHAAGNIEPAKIGGTFLFTKEQLDHFIANRRPCGRPKT